MTFEFIRLKQPNMSAWLAYADKVTNTDARKLIDKYASDGLNTTNQHGRDVCNALVTAQFNDIFKDKYLLNNFMNDPIYMLFHLEDEGHILWIKPQLKTFDMSKFVYFEDSDKYKEIWNFLKSYYNI